MTRSSARSSPTGDTRRLNAPGPGDLREIRAYIGQDSERYARVVVARLVIAVRRLREYPLSGRVVSELGLYVETCSQARRERDPEG